MRWNERLRLWHRALRFLLRTERFEIALVRRVLQPGDLAIDIGAHKAAFTYWMAKAVGKSGTVLAFEPLPQLANYLRDAAKVIPGGQVNVFQCALSSHPGTASLHFPGPHYGCASLESVTEASKSGEPPMHDPITVATRTLDSVLRENNRNQPVSFIKCDVEQHELAVLQGAIDTLRRDRPMLLFESGNLTTGSETSGAVFEFLESLGYEGHFIYENRCVPLRDFSPSQFRIDPKSYQNYCFHHPTRHQWHQRAHPISVQRLEFSANRQDCSESPLTPVS